jgi:hypothetical protein
MPANYGSNIVNGQLVKVPTGQSFAPLTFGAIYTGPGFWPRNGVYNSPPVVPSPGMWAGGEQATAAGSIGAQATGLGGGMNSAPSAASISPTSGKVNFLHPTKSPVVMALVFLVGGLALMHFVHYKR